jgi:hypothetical protein
MARIHRRHFLGGAVGVGVLAHLGDFSFLDRLPSVTAGEAKLRPETVQLDSDVEPLVRLLEDTPREKVIDATVEQIHLGTSYQQLLAAVFLAGVRGIKPRPVGFKFHAVLVINSAHLAAQAAPDSDRWLPLLWAMDNFKSSQAANAKENDGWMLPPPHVAEDKRTTASEATKHFAEAMDNWDEGAADDAVTSLARSASAGEIIELFWRYGARDFRDIGHKAIYVANSWRALQAIGWRHAEPVLRSLTLALLEHEGDNPAKRDAEADVPWRENLKRAAKIPEHWQTGKPSAEASTDLLQTLRKATAAEASEKVVELLNREVDPASVWDGLFLTAGELLMRQPGIVALHTMTSANALHQGYQLSVNDETRRMMMLQAAAFLTLFRKRMESSKLREDRQIAKIEPAKVKAKGPEAIEDILSEISNDRVRAASKMLGLVDADPGSVSALMTAARRLVFSKGNDSHDYKFSSAVLEDYYHLSPKWRNCYLASAAFHLHGSGDKDNDLIKRARGALAR